MSINNNVTQMIFNHIKTNFTYKYYTKEDNTDLALDSNIVTNYDIDWSLVGVLKGDRVVISDGINTFTSYVAEEPINSLVLEDNSEYAFTNASITIYFLPKLYKEYAPEQIELPYDIFTYISRIDSVLFANDRLYHYEFQINLYDDNTDDTDIEATKDEYIRLFDRLCILSYNGFYCVHNRLIEDLGVKVNTDEPNSTIILENVITFNLIIKEDLYV